jgi:hypothetical protein
MQGETSALPPLTPRRRLRAAGHAVEFGQKVQGYSVGDHYRPVQPDDEQDGSLPSVTKRGNSPRLNSPGQGGHLHSTGQPTGRSRAARTSFAKTPTAVPTASLSPTSATPSPTGQFASPRVAMLWAKSTNAVMSDTAEQKRKQRTEQIEYFGKLKEASGRIDEALQKLQVSAAGSRPTCACTAQAARTQFLYTTP